MTMRLENGHYQWMSEGHGHGVVNRTLHHDDMTNSQNQSTFSIYRVYGHYVYPVFVVATDDENDAIAKASKRFIGLRPETASLVVGEANSGRG